MTMKEMNFYQVANGIADPILIVGQLQGKYQVKGKHLHFAFVDLEKAFDGVP